MSTNSFKLHAQLQQDCLHIVDLNLCRALLMNESQFPWVLLVPRCEDISEVYELNTEQQQQLQNESNQVSEVLLREYPGCKLNIATLGNIVSQLHVHHIARFHNDVSWPGPVWGNFNASPYSETKKIEKVAAWRAWLT